MAATIRAFNSARMINSSSPLMDELTEDVKTLFQSNLGKKRISDIINKKEIKNCLLEQKKYLKHYNND